MNDLDNLKEKGLEYLKIIKDKSVVIFNSESFKSISKVLLIITSKLFTQHSIFKFKRKLNKKYEKDNALDIYKDLKSSDIEKIRKENQSKNLASELIYVNLVYILLGFTWFCHLVASVNDFSYRFTLIMFIISILTPFIQNKSSTTGRKDIDLIIHYYSNKDCSLKDLYEIEKSYYSLIKELMLDSKSEISSVELMRPKVDNIEYFKEDEKLGAIFKINFDNTENIELDKISSINYLKPVFSSSDCKFYTVIFNSAYLMLDVYLAKDLYKHNVDFIEIYKDNNLFFENLSDFDEAKKSNRIEEVKKDLEARNLNIKATKLIKTLDKIEENKEKIGFNAWDSFNKGIEGNGKYLKLKCKFLGDMTLNKLNIDLIEKVVNADVALVANPNSKETFDLIITFNKFLDLYELSFDELTKYAKEENKLFLGRTITGDFLVDMTKNAFFPLISGGSGAGKTVAMLSLVAQLLTLRDSNYDDLFIVSGGKSADFYACGLEEKGAIITDTLEDDELGITEEDKIMQIVKTLTIAVKLMNKRESMFKRLETDNLSSFNKKSKQKLGEVLVIVDEFQSLLNIASGYKINKDKVDLIINKLVKQLMAKGRSSGFKLIIVSQSPKVSDLGDGIRDGINFQMLGRNEANVLSSLNANKIAKHFGDISLLNKRTEGVMFVKSTVVSGSNQLNFQNGYVLTQTPFIEKSEIRNNLNLKFDTYKKYNDLIKSSEIDLDNISEYLTSNQTNTIENVNSTLESDIVENEKEEDLIEL